tara:strand:+ start:7406 stop:7645 length:240 start_codon:yes stop_codon:yes gene_type:complete
MDKDVPENTQIKKRSVRISGHNTSITVEPEFWCALKTIAQQDGVSVNKLISEIDKDSRGNLSSAIRVYILKHLQNRLAQ